ncbi:ArsR/SmtB family transcription factor [Kitasatospora viridis]|uniref:ArsR family transcriptional regulator n=1 Tax=Kitasatospora viridis TaxID=281105 RepID=A0A561S9H8_9ACTN|nr:helix-turn-helix transcriptional regulator [Kitasatospora viridis]TWF71528.1 ArsR family transcriptional regulator [Kitasatospora viridis]
MNGDVDFAPVAALLGEPGRARVLAALADGRALPASVLAAEAGLAASTTSGHLSKLLDGGLLVVERHGRHRYYRLAGPEVAVALEALARLSPTRPVRSLRQGNRAHALRAARSCYDHLAGRLGVALMRALLERGALTGHDGSFDPTAAQADRLSAPGWDVEYRLTESGRQLVDGLGLVVPVGRRPLIRYCVDWSEQQHHLAGRLGAAFLDHALAEDWVSRTPTRALRLTERGREAFEGRLGLAV